MRFAIWSILLFALLMSVLYWSDFQGFFIVLTGSRAFIPYSTLALFSASAYCSVRFFHQSYTTKKRSILGLLMALPIFIWLAWRLIKLATRSYPT
jgi:hypothetical protein